jgi:geranylgeranyl diphosphate synthase, type III
MEHEPDTACLEPFNYLLQMPGKDVRGGLIDCFQLWLQIPDDKLDIIKEIVSSLHNASLLVDDIEDNSKMRRGKPVAHAIYGVPTTINCANYVYFLALAKCETLERPEAVSIFIKELLNLHRGQGQDILWREQCYCPTENEYKHMVLDKTGGLFRLAIGLMQIFTSPENKVMNFSELIYWFSLYFQIRDDYCNVASANYMKDKTFCEDLSEGKFSFPVIHSINANNEDKRLLNILRQRTEDVEIKKHAVEYIESTGSLDYTRVTLNDLRIKILHEIDNIGGKGQDPLKNLLSKLDCVLPTGIGTETSDLH